MSPQVSQSTSCLKVKKYLILFQSDLRKKNDWLAAERRCDANNALEFHLKKCHGPREGRTNQSELGNMLTAKGASQNQDSPIKFLLTGHDFR